MQMGGKDSIRWAPPIVWDHWLHAFEVRFLIGQDSYLPPPPKNLKKNRAFLVEVPLDSFLVLNLLVGRDAAKVPPPIPRELAPAMTLWRSRLRNQRPVLLLGRLIPMDDSNRKLIDYYRREMNPKVNFSKLPEKPYVELRPIAWDAVGGNVMLVIPMGKEAIRTTPEPTDAEAGDSRAIAISSPPASISINAPNGAVVATLSLSGVTRELTIRRNVDVRGNLGTATLTIDASSLIVGDDIYFRTPRISCTCLPSIDEGQPRVWDYSVHARFDGHRLHVEISPMSVALRSSNLDTAMRHVRETEEIIFKAPVETLHLSADASAPQTTISLEASFLLRDK